MCAHAAGIEADDLVHGCGGSLERQSLSFELFEGVLVRRSVLDALEIAVETRADGGAPLIDRDRSAGCARSQYRSESGGSGAHDFQMPIRIPHVCVRSDDEFRQRLPRKSLRSISRRW